MRTAPVRVCCPIGVGPPVLVHTAPPPTRVREVPVYRVREVVREVPKYRIYERYRPPMRADPPLKPWVPPPLPPPEPPPPPRRAPLIVRPPPPQPCRCCDHRPEPPSAFSRAKKRFVKKLTPKPTLRLGDMGIDQLHCLDDCALIDYAITAAAALAAGDDDDDGEVVVEAVCPTGARPGDSLEVCAARERPGLALRTLRATLTPRSPVPPPPRRHAPSVPPHLPRPCPSHRFVCRMAVASGRRCPQAWRRGKRSTFIRSRRTLAAAGGSRAALRRATSLSVPCVRLHYGYTH